jgi:hypothetical protein
VCSNALRKPAIEESASLNRRMAERARNSKEQKMVATFEERAINAERNSDTLRNFLIDLGSPDADLESRNDAAD